MGLFSKGIVPIVQRIPELMKKYHLVCSGTNYHTKVHILRYWPEGVESPTKDVIDGLFKAAIIVV